MPYIKQEERNYIYVINPGQLNHSITEEINAYLEDKGVSYATINECIGVLECAKLELYRRIAAPYEDIKKEENGDVYTVNTER